MTTNLNPVFSVSTVLEAAQALALGHLLAYPTEAVFGLGCDPDNEQAVLSLYHLKQRSLKKGLILIASSFEQLQPYIELDAMSQIQLEAVTQTWPGPYTWVMPSKNTTPHYLRGEFDTIAVRVSAHPIVNKLCQHFGKPIVSTSANISGYEPARNAEEVFEQFGQSVVICEGNVGGLGKPTTIRDAITGEIFRG
ncbi:L-threonylcarbamoyladenylate synthase [Thorsellia anophelis]|uniref:Threonylcarbamoyl-AMP synthase n=1 Tax=Thorsellia anophelis DSM 18579 TaxID=1123402 RepID=A0A1H9YRK4_9GAMM|nr:L-threonylcarbamoyladenylate synthase [Thorsellia anophelis]SES71804.1 translation factor SUA5 [Thorsellia anophelis DSM 18579]